MVGQKVFLLVVAAVDIIRAMGTRSMTLGAGVLSSTFVGVGTNVRMKLTPH